MDLGFFEQFLSYFRGFQSYYLNEEHLNLFVKDKIHLNENGTVICAEINIGTCFVTNNLGAQ